MPNIPRDRLPGRRRRPETRPTVERLESRRLLYSATGAWTAPIRITFSFAPDGTSIGGVPSRLLQDMDAQFPRQTWQDQFRQAAAVWEAVAGVNLVEVSDDGSAIGVAGFQQGDPRFGDIRIGGYDQGMGSLGFAFNTPPANGGTLAGDVFLNTSQTWRLNADYDLLTVAIHEMGHALGLGHSDIEVATQYATYGGLKQTLNSDDTAGIRSIYGARSPDRFDATAANNSYTKATPISSYIDPSNQIALPNLDIASPSDSDWYYVVAPAATASRMTVAVQSTNLSLLSPKVLVYTSALRYQGASSAPFTYGATASLTVSGVTPGQGYFIRAMTANSGPTGAGAYGLLVNFGTLPQSPIAPFSVSIPSQPDQGGGSMGQRRGKGNGSISGLVNRQFDSETISVGSISALGHRDEVPEVLGTRTVRTSGWFTSTWPGAWGRFAPSSAGRIEGIAAWQPVHPWSSSLTTGWSRRPSTSIGFGRSSDGAVGVAR